MNSSNINYNTSLLWDNTSINNAIGISIKKPLNITGISIDSRNVKKGDLFIGIKGDNHDGSDFVNQALESGAELCIINKLPGNFSGDIDSVLVVDDSYQIMYKLAEYARKRFKGKILGVTGSAGKTSTKEMLKIALTGCSDKVFATLGNQNSRIGVPLSLCALPEEYEFAVFEMGMSQAGEMACLSALVRPDIAIIVNIGSAHLSSFNSVEDIAKAKAEIFLGMSKVSSAILNYDNQYSTILEKNAIQAGLEVIYFGKASTSNVRLLDYNSRIDRVGDNIDEVSYIKASLLGNQFEYSIGSLGEHFVYNSLSVIAALYAVGANIEQGISRLKQFKALQGRGKFYTLNKDQIILIDDSYNANPDSIKASLLKLAHYKKHDNRIIAILGDMKELGSDSRKLHLSLLDSIILNKVDKVFAVGELMQDLFQNLPSAIQGVSALSSDIMALNIIDYIKPKDILLVKGSFKVEMSKVVGAILQSFS